MITLYTWKTPNGRKPAIMLEEICIPYRTEAVDLTADRQFDPAFLRISPNNKIPGPTRRSPTSRAWPRRAPKPRSW